MVPAQRIELDRVSELLPAACSVLLLIELAQRSLSAFLEGLVLIDIWFGLRVIAMLLVGLGCSVRAESPIPRTEPVLEPATFVAGCRRSGRPRAAARRGVDELG